LVDAGAKGAEPPEDDFVPGEPFGVPEATAKEGEGPNGDDGDGESFERRSLGGAQEQPGCGGHERQGGEFGSSAEKGGAEKPKDSSGWAVCRGWS
jgi:hypothetical protein